MIDSALPYAEACLFLVLATLLGASLLRLAKVRELLRQRTQALQEGLATHAVRQRLLRQRAELAELQAKHGDQVREALAAQRRDLTRMHRAALNIMSDMDEARRAADAANRAKSEFLATMSHELRTPLSGVLTSARELLDTELDEEQRMLARTLVTSGDGLLRIINDILDISKIEAGRMELESIPTDLPGLCREVCQLMAPAARARGLAFVADIDAGLPTGVETDPGRLRQVLLNLLGNAVKFTEQGEVALSVRVQSESAEAGKVSVRFAVRDTGIGIDAPALERVFEKFTQADSSTTRHYGGTGLGLTISRQLTGLLGADLQAESRVGSGSTFHFTLPLRVVALDAASLRAPAMPLGKGVRVLLVDDNRVNLALGRRILQRLDCEVHTALDGVQAVTACEAQCFDIVLMDCQMPVMDGFEATRSLRQSGHDLPIVAMTANAMAGDRERCLEAGMDAYLTKPVDKAKLAQTMAELLAARPGAGQIGARA